MVGSYAVGDVRALVPTRKAVWSSGNTFFLLPPFLLYYCYLSIFIIIYLFVITSSYSVITSYCLYSLCFRLFLRYHQKSNPLSNSQSMTDQRIDVDVDVRATKYRPFHYHLPAIFFSPHRLTSLSIMPFFLCVCVCVGVCGCVCVCGTVSSMLSGLETRSLGLNTLGTT